MDTSYSQLYLSVLVGFFLFYHIGNRDMINFSIESEVTIAIRILSFSCLISSSDRVFSINQSNEKSEMIVVEIPHMTTPYVYATNTCRNRISGQYTLYSNSTRFVRPTSYDKECM